MLVPAVALAAAFGSQYLGHLVPCEMCWYQRYAHFIGLGFAVLALLLSRMPDRGRSFVWLSALGIFASGALGAFHAGCERKLWDCMTQCTAPPVSGSATDILNDIMSRPMVRCDDIQFQLFGVSMAGWNAIFSIAGALVILWLSLRKPKNPALA